MLQRESDLELITRVGLALQEYNLTRQLYGSEKAKPLFDDVYRIVFNHGQECAESGAEKPLYLSFFSSLTFAWQTGYNSIKDQVVSIPKRIILNGQAHQFIDDSNKSIGTFSIDSSISREISQHEKSEAKKIAIDLYRQYSDKNEIKDGSFISSNIVITDQFNQAVHFYDGKVWDFGNKYVNSSDLYKLDVMIVDLHNRANLESSWDNHDTARVLRNKAYLISVKLDIYRNILKNVKHCK